MQKFASLVTVLLFGAGALFAQESAEKPLPLNGQITTDGSSVTLDWFDTAQPRVGTVKIERRVLGETGAASWQTIAPNLGVAMRYSDTTTKAGVAYEYRVTRMGRDIIDVGHWATGIDVPAQDQRGRAYVVIDTTIAGPLELHLNRYMRDLVGDGWQIFRYDAGRGSNDVRENLVRFAQIKSWLNARYQEDPATAHAVILVGHVPIMQSGRANPDGHEAVPHATDLVYGDVDGIWRLHPDGVLGENQVPSDFIEMQVGRIDFAPVSSGSAAVEQHLLQAYFSKLHHWRMGFLGDLREAYGTERHLQSEFHDLRNIVGPDAVTPGGHHDVGEQRPWLWGVDFGDWRTTTYAEKYANKAVFALNFGSSKQKIDLRFNGLTALLAQPWYPIAAGWGARPAWRLHLMALGGTIGTVHMRTVNNGVADQPYRASMDYFPTGDYLWRNPVWVNLLGDPTAHAFVLAPASKARAVGSSLSWTPSPDPDVLGYRVYRAQTGADFVVLNGGDLITQTRFTDPDPVPDARYMIRAYGRKQVYAGSFYTLSQGVFATPGYRAVTAQDIALKTSAQQAMALPDSFRAPTGGIIQTVIAPPAAGRLSFDGTDWLYTPEVDFRGTVVIPFSVSDAEQTDVGQLTITVTD